MSSQVVGEEEEYLCDVIAQFLQSPIWLTPVNNFIDEHCVHFDAAEENKLIYTDIHRKYSDLTERLITEALLALGISDEEFAFAVGQGSRLKKLVFGHLLAADEFPVFKSIMVRRNVQLGAEALKELSRAKSTVQMQKQMSTKTEFTDHDLYTAGVEMTPEQLERITQEKRDQRLALALQKKEAQLAEMDLPELAGGMVDDTDGAAEALRAAIEHGMLEADALKREMERQEQELKAAIALSLEIEQEQEKEREQKMIGSSNDTSNFAPSSGPLSLQASLASDIDCISSSTSIPPAGLIGESKQEEYSKSILSAQPYPEKVDSGKLEFTTAPQPSSTAMKPNNTTISSSSSSISKDNEDLNTNTHGLTRLDSSVIKLPPLKQQTTVPAHIVKPPGFNYSQHSLANPEEVMKHHKAVHVKRQIERREADLRSYHADLVSISSSTSTSPPVCSNITPSTTTLDGNCKSDASIHAERESTHKLTNPIAQNSAILADKNIAQALRARLKMDMERTLDKQNKTKGL